MLLYPEGMVKLNGSAGEIMKRCDGERDVQAIVADLEAAFSDDGARRRRARVPRDGGQAALAGVGVMVTAAAALAQSAERDGATRPAAVAAGRADLPLSAALRVLLQPGRLRATRTTSSPPTTGCACCAQGRALGAVQLGLSGGEPLLRDDLEVIVAEARRLGYYTNLITSGVGLTPSARRGAEGRRARSRPAVVPGLDARDERLPLAHARPSS